MKNLLDPRQYTPYALNTPSGNLNFVENVDNFECYLLNKLTGDFNIIGNLQVNTGDVLFIDSSNEVEDNNNVVINSLSCVASGQKNAIFNSDNSELSGSFNSIFGGQSNQIADADHSSIIFGEQCVIQFHTGSALIGDGDLTRTKQSVKDYSLTIDFASGLFIKNDLYLEGDLYSTGNTSIFTSDIHVAAANSGLFSGDIQVLGIAYHTGSPLQNLQNLIDASGDLVNQLTGASGVLNTKIDTTSGHLKESLDATGANMVKTNTHQVITAPKYFNVITGLRVNVAPSGAVVPATYNAAGNSGDFVGDENYLYFCTGTNLWGRVALSAW